ncbi:unnamed protein product [Camellia sinensis]
MELSGSNGNSLSYQPNKLDFDTHFSDEISEEVNDSPIEQVRLTVPYSALLDILNMGFGDFFMCYPDILEPILWLSPKRALYFLCFNPNCYSSHCKVYGSISANQVYPNPVNKMDIFNESRAIQLERACSYHHFCQFSFEYCICSGYYYHSEGVLSSATLSSCSHVVNLNYPDAWVWMGWSPSSEALHDAETRPKGGLTRLEFFIAVLISSFSYFIVPNYLFPSITALFFVCWIWKDSVTAQQICSGLHGLGIGSFALDWSTVAGFLGSPLVTPGFAILNILVGYIAIVYVVIPIAYWTNWFEAKRFPIFSAHVFNDGGLYAFNRQGYESNSKIHLSIFFAFIYGLSFATLAATLSHVALFHGR